MSNYQHPETNPHFLPEDQQDDHDQLSLIPQQWAPRQRQRHSPRPAPWMAPTRQVDDPNIGQPSASSNVGRPNHPGQSVKPPKMARVAAGVPPTPTPTPTPTPKTHDLAPSKVGWPKHPWQRDKPPKVAGATAGSLPTPQTHDLPHSPTSHTEPSQYHVDEPQAPATKPRHKKARPDEPTRPITIAPTPPQTQPDQQNRFRPSPFTSPPDHPHHHQPHSLMPKPQRTKPITWFAAVFCTILWLIIILGGLAVLIVYLVFKPRSPKFDVSSVTLNAAYLDMGYLLNADVTILANFTNPNRKVNVDFSYMYLELYYESTLIATQYIEPFRAPSAASRFVTMHLVTSQVRLRQKETMLLQKQLQSNRVIFQVKGVFRTRSDFGSFLKYSYWLYGHCSLLVSAPPTGVLRDRRCRTKR